MIKPASLTRNDQLQDAKICQTITALEAEEYFTTADHYRFRGYFTSEKLLYRLNDEDSDFCPLQQISPLFNDNPEANHPKTIMKLGPSICQSYALH